MSKNLVERLRDAAELATPERVRENLCNEAAGNIEGLTAALNECAMRLGLMVLVHRDFSDANAKAIEMANVALGRSERSA